MAGRLRGPTPGCEGSSTPDGDQVAGSSSVQGGSSGGPTEEGDRGVQGVARIRDGHRLDGEGISGVRVSTGSDPTPGSASGVEIKLDPFITLPEDANVAMADEQPFDESLSLPEE
ncbi:hypothetical protein B296_00025868 [Ensete ventricosum]|uniref:Uncharacterized protein n=1 Tax=Ensete ventricosum TaxID=4639 RepID=A0A426XAN4_ENSVE|nr:hypothetical protein B296_00025868 [Ensete ventricosum]